MVVGSFVLLEGSFAVEDLGAVFEGTVEKHSTKRAKLRK